MTLCNWRFLILNDEYVTGCAKFWRPFTYLENGKKKDTTDELVFCPYCGRVLNIEKDPEPVTYL